MKFSEDWQAIQWRAVKAVANNDLSRILGIVPLAGYLILFNDEIANLASFDTFAGIAEESVSPFFLEGLTKLRLVFFGSLFVFSSYVIYRVFRPPVLDWSNGEIEFASRVQESYTVEEVASMEATVFSAGWKPRREGYWILLGSVRTQPMLIGYRPDVRSRMFEKHGDYISFLAREWWAGMMHVRRPARVAAIVLGVSGYILLALPTLDLAQAVVCDMLFSP
jgi:hypothetical protein